MRRVLVDKELESVVETCRGVLDRWSGKGLVAVYLYGSVLGSRRRQDSDIDVACLDREDTRVPWSDQARLMDDLERALEAPVDLRMLRDLTTSHQAHVIEEGRAIRVEDASELESFELAVREGQIAGRAESERVWSRTLHDLARIAKDRDEPRLPR